MPPPNDFGWPGHAGYRTFNQALAAAIADVAEHGYVSPERIADWVTQLRNAAERQMGPGTMAEREIARALGSIFERLTERGGVFRYTPEVSRYTLAMIKPQLRAELDRRILAAADLVKLDRQRAVQATLDRFSGWATSIPPGGDATIDKADTRQNIGKSVARVRYHQRLVANDQGHKLVANIADIVAQDSGAIAGIWHDHGEHDRSYNARKEHMARSGLTYLVRGSWAHQRGLVKPVNGFIDEYEMVGRAVNCRCWYEYVASPRRLPDAFLTRAGQEFVARKAA